MQGDEFAVAPSPVGTVVFSGPILDTVTYSDTIDMWGYGTLNVRIALSNLGTGPITAVAAILQWTDVTDPAAEDWATVQLETLGTGGAITENDAVYTFDVSTLTAPFSLPLLGAASGRLMRVGVSATGGASDSAAVLTATRR